MSAGLTESIETVEYSHGSVSLTRGDNAYFLSFGYGNPPDEKRAVAYAMTQLIPDGFKHVEELDHEGEDRFCMTYRRR